MPSPKSSRKLLEHLAANQRASIKSRLDALQRLQTLKPSLAALNRILAHPETPLRVLEAALNLRDSQEADRKRKPASPPGANVLGS